MDLLITKLQSLKETTQSREVRDLCDVYINELKKGSTEINESQIVQSLESKIENTISPLEALRNEEIERSKSRAKMLAESWGGLNSFSPSRNSGSYVDGKKDERETSEVENKLNEALSQMARFDKSAESFINSNRVENLGIFESIVELSKKGIYEHSSFKILCENYVNLIKNKSIPEYWIAESFVADFSNYSWDSSVKEKVNRVTESINQFRPEIEASKALYQIQNSGNTDFYSPVKESISKWLVSESKSIPALSKELGVWSFNPIVRNLINSLGVLESNSSKVTIPTINGNSEVKKVYSPVLVENGRTIFVIGKTIFEGTSNSDLRKMTDREISYLDREFLNLLESFYSEGVKVDENGVSIYTGETKISIVEEKEQTKVYINGTEAKFDDYNQLAKMITLNLSKGLGLNESKVVYNVVRLYENFDKIVELDFAKSIISKIYEGASVNLIKWEGGMYLHKINESMRENSLYSVNGSQASNIVKDFLRYDISEGLTEFLDGEKKIKSIMINDRKKVIENISIVESEMKKIESLVSTNPLYKGSKQLAQAYTILEKELQVLKSKWSTINAELDSIENNAQEIEELMEDSKFSVGDYVKVKENGNTGKIISVDTTSGSYTVLLDSGKTGDYGVEDIIDLEDAFNKSGEENEEGEMKESTQPLAKAPSAGKNPHGKSSAQVMKSSISVAPFVKSQDKDGKKDVENLKDANLEEAPNSKNKPTEYEVNDEIGYNLEESQDSMVVAPGGKSKSDMSTEFEKSGLKAANLAKAPGKEEGDSGYKMEFPEPKKKRPELMGNSNLSAAPGMGRSKVEESDLSKLNPSYADSPGTKVGDSGYKIKYPNFSSSSPEIDDLATMNLSSAPGKGSKIPSKDKTNPNFATAPGKEVGDSGYEVEYPEYTNGEEYIDNLDSMDLAGTPSKGAEGDIHYQISDEMGYNLDEGFERPSPELKKN